MSRTRVNKQPGIFFAALIAVTLPAVLSANNPLDAVVVMDSSGSMKKTDPRELRKPAAKLFINLLGKQDQISVVSFSDNAYPITFLSPLNTEENTQRALDATDRVSSKGIYTNLYAAINKGIEFLKNSEQQKHQPVILLLSDGKMDIGNTDESEILRNRIFSELLPELKENNIRIYSIAFTQESDQTLLQEIADATNGHYALAESDEALHKVFAKMFELSKEPNMLPLKENQFLVDKSIQEVTILVNKTDNNNPILLQHPSGERYSASTEKNNLKWFTSPEFDMITITKPEPGDWKILFSNNDNRAYIVADIQLRSQFEYDKTGENQAFIKTWFEKDEQIINRDELLGTLELKLEIEQPNGEIIRQGFEYQTEDGVFSTNFTPTMDGIYAATVIADSKTFQRQQFFSFKARLPEKPVEVKPEQPAAAEETPQVEPPESSEAPQAIQPPESIPEPEAGDENSSDFIDDLLIFVLANLAILFIAVNGFFIFRHLKNRKPGKNSTS